MKTNNTTNIPEEVLQLVPWFAIGKLSEEDKAFFENALLSYPSLQEQLNLEKQMIDLVSEDSVLLNYADGSLVDKSVIAAPEERLKAVFNVIDNLEPATKAQRQSDATGSLVERLKNAFDSLIPNLGIKPQYARFASVSVLALSVAVIASIVIPSKTETSDFTTASAVTQPIDNQEKLASTTKIVLLVGFNGTSEELSNNDVLKGKQIKIGSPADNNGFYKISFKDSMTADEVKQTIDALLAQKETIWFAGEAF
ncbi:hypothetical protein [uncultured Cocleimonas sp.]|uniref:hypothetical protein n=1 Tax=uncultured Cocleimonas sp. TaxID=1051587 RepID=UPI0026143471|nr:hypothetical protein [uncultured Cocleimonas sp.]